MSVPAAAPTPGTSPLALHPKNPMRVPLLSVLGFEIVVFALAIPVMILVSGVDPLPAALFGSGSAVLSLAAAGMLRKPVGYPLGWLAQLWGVLLGLLTPSMFVVGGMFAALWTVSFILGKRLDERAAPSAR